MQVVLAFLVAFSLCVVHTFGLAVMSIDLGIEYMKIAIVRPGVPMEIALNKDSRRKTPVAVAFDKEDRLFGDAAMVKVVRYPKQAYLYLQDVLGKTRDNPGVARFEQRFPHYKLEQDPERKTVIFKHSDDTEYTPEELLAMVLEEARDVASDFAEQPVTDAVITVPPFFNQVERRAMLRAADLAGLKVLQLMNDNTAVALNYGVFRHKVFNATAVHYMFFDMGAGSTTATVVGYQLVKAKNPVSGILETNPQLTIEGVGYERALGGIQYQLRLRDHLVKLFNKGKKTKSDITKNIRSMAKLYKEAGRVKHVLSANNDHFSQVEGLLDEEDFRAKVSRAELEEMTADLSAMIAKPIEEAMKTAQVTWDEISEVILMGGATRMPKVQEMLTAATGRSDLGKSINTDESAAMGAVYQAAHLSKGFRVKKFTVKDATVFPIQVEFDRVKTGEETSMDVTQKMVKRTLFGRMNAFPQKKVMTFNKHTKDFTFKVNYGDLSFMDPVELSEFGSTQLQQVVLTGVETAYTKHQENTESKGVKAHFRVDDSGILTLDKVESVFERPPDAVPEEAEASTLQKLGSFFFGSSDKDAEKKEDGQAEEVKEEIKAEKEEEKKEEAKEEEKKDEIEKKEEKVEKEETEDKKSVTNEKVEPKSEEKKEEKKEDKSSEKEEKKEGKNKKKDKKGKKENADEKADGKEEDKDKKDKDKKEEAKPEEKKPPKPTIVKEDITMEATSVDLIDPSSDDITISKRKMHALKIHDQEKRQLEASRNDLESFIIEGKDHLYQAPYEAASTEPEREDIRTKLSEASDWLDEQDETAGKKAYVDKLAELKKLLGPLYGRVKEHEERPRAIEALKSVFNYSQHFLITMKNFTGEDQPFTQVEYDTLSKLINDTKEWNKSVMAEQKNTPLHEKPKLMVDDLARKINDLDREVKYLINKAKVFKPKVKKEKTEKKTNATKTEKTTSEKKTSIDEKTKSNETRTETRTEEKVEEKKEEGATIDATPTTDATPRDEKVADKEFKVPKPVAEKPEEEPEEKTHTKEKEKEKTANEGVEEEPLQLDGAKAEESTEKKEDTNATKEKPDDKKAGGHDPEDEL